MEPQSWMPLGSNDAPVEVYFCQREKHLYPSLRNPYDPLALANEPECLKKKRERNAEGTEVWEFLAQQAFSFPK